MTGLTVFGDVVGYGGARVIVRHTGKETRVAMVNTDEDGRYRASLEPGDYAVDFYTGPFPKAPSKTVRVEVRDGRTTVVPTYQGYDPRGADVRSAVFYRIRRVVRAEVDRLGLVRDGARYLLCGAHAAATEPLFGPVAAADDRHVYVAFLQGDPTASSPRVAETRALRGGGYVALLLTADDFETLASHVSDAPLDTDAASAMFPPAVGLCYVY